MTIYNNADTMNFSHNNKSFTHINYFNVKYQFVREKIHKHHTCINHITTNCMLLDLLAKGLAVEMFQKHVISICLAKSFDILG